MVDDDRIPIDESSRRDYRMLLPDKHLRTFMKRFDKSNKERENISNVSREFIEELVDTEILNWRKISYRFCGRHITELSYSKHFQCYELLLADIVELIPTEEQMKDLKRLMKDESSDYYFATTDEIKSLGVCRGTGKLEERIGDHSVKILQESEQDLERTNGYGNVYEVKW